MRENNIHGAAAGNAFAVMLAQNTALKELDLSSQTVDKKYGHALDAAFAKELAAGIRDNGALSIANVLGNSFGKETLSKLQEIMCSKPNLISLCGIADDATEADLSGLNMDADDAIILASELPDKGALLRLDMSDNEINFNISGEAAAVPGKALADALAANTVLTELNLCKNYLKPEFIRELAVGIGDNGAISSINLLKNKIPVEQAQELVKIMQTKENLTTLCGLSREETELDFSDQHLGAGDAMLIANDISDMKAISSLNLAKNSLAKDGALAICEALLGSSRYTNSIQLTTS
jgi:hypothetical protein